MKIKAASDPGMKARVEKMEERAEKVEELKAALEAAGKAQGEEKARLLQEFGRKRQALMEAREMEMAQMKAQAEGRKETEMVTPGGTTNTVPWGR